MKIKQLRRIHLSQPTQLIDIGVADDHTFFVSDKPDGTYVLTHNSFPDIDSDFADREQAVKLLQEYFGEENVIPVSNFAALKPLSLIKDLSKLYNIPFEEVNRYTVTMISEVMGVKKSEPGFDAAQFELTFEDLEKFSPSFQGFMANVANKIPGFQDTMDVLWKQQRNCGRHAGGVIITQDARDAMPLIKAKGGLQTPWPEGLAARHLEEFGLLKFDILGLGTLRVFEECIRRILKKQGNKYPTFPDIRQFFFEKLHPDNNSLNDQKVFKHIYWESRYAGVFQFVKDNVQKFMAQMRPTSVRDIAIATSIYRPGPMCVSHDTEILVSQNYWNENGSKGNRKSSYYKSIETLYQEWNFPSPKCQNKFSICSYDESNQTIVANKIENVVKSGKKEVFEVDVQTNLSGKKRIMSGTASGIRTRVLKATSEHRFFTLNGWKELQELIPGKDYLLFMSRGNIHKPLEKCRASKNIPGERHFNDIAFRGYQYKCIFCNWNKGSLDVNHLAGNRSVDNSIGNLCFMCPNHHRQYSEGTISETEARDASKKLKLVLNKDVCMVRYMGRKSLGMQETYDICMTAPHHNFIAGGFIVHNSLGAHNAFLKNRQDPESVEYVHPVLKEILEPTGGLLIFQEQLQIIVNRLSGMHLDDTDSIRKAFTKKDKSNAEKQAKEIVTLGEKFVTDCMSFSGISKKDAESVWKDFEKWTAYGFNLSHAMAYAITSYQCAWLLTYYPDEWIASYLDFATVGKGGNDSKSIAIMEARSLGYHVAKPDINLSEDDFTMPSAKVLVPSFSAIKGVGKASLVEIKTHRPYTKISDLVVNPDGSWKHTKFNKKAFGNLIKTGAFESMSLVGEGKTFKNYKQMYTVFIDNYDALKKMSARKKNNDVVAEVNRLIQEVITTQPNDWTTDEKIEHSKELTGQVDMSLIVSPEMFDYFLKAKIETVDSWDNEGEFYWAIVDSCSIDTSTTGKDYLRMSFHGDSGAKKNCKVWNFNKEKDTIFKKNDILIGKFKKNNFGMSAFPNQLKRLTNNNSKKA